MSTAFQGGLESYGVPVLPSTGGALSGNAWFVDGNTGSNQLNDGKSRGAPFKTMAQALASVGSGDTIYVWGNVTENLTAPAGVFDVTIIGIGTRPRHADGHTGNNGYKTATWKASSQTEPLLIVRQQGWRFVNILFDAPTSDAALEFIRDAAAGDSERDSSHAEVIGCRFASGAIGILISGTEIVHNVLVQGCVFNDLTHAIKTPIAAGYARRWIIRNNQFVKNTNHIVAGLAQSNIYDNIFSAHTTLSIDLTGGGGENIITKNYLSGTYSEGGGYLKSNANDEWAGNWNTLAGGITISDPA